MKNQLAQKLESTEKRIKEIAMKHSSDYTDIELASTSVQLIAIEATLEGTMQANADLQEVITLLRKQHGMTEVEVSRLFRRDIPEKLSFQARVKKWVHTCFGDMTATDKHERSHRFLEEALELVQSCGCSQRDAHALVDYVYNRPAGDIEQEAGGVKITFSALCSAHEIDMDEAGENELQRVWVNTNKIRRKQATKPTLSSLPGKEVTDTPTPYHV